MVRISTLFITLLHGLMKLAGVRQREVEIEKGTVIRFWVSNCSQPTTNAKINQGKLMMENPSKPTIVFLHGFALDGILTWQFQVLSLAKKYDIYVPDFLFFGGSTTDKKERSLAFQAECIAMGLKKLGVAKCSLVGFSYGGMVGFKMAEMFPDLVDALVVTGSVVALTESLSHAGLQRIGFSSWQKFLLPNTAKEVKELLHVGSYRWPWIPEFVYTDFLQVMFDKNRKEKIELLEAMIVQDKDFRIARYSQKIFLLWGEDDKIFNKEVVRSLEEQLEGNVTVHLVKKAGHLVQVERPLAYNRQLKQIAASLY